MAANLNKVFLMGNLTRDPELRYTPSGMAVCKLGLATSRRFRGRNSDEWREEVCFVDITVWDKSGENCSQYLAKGSPVLVEGRLNFRTWESEGQKRSKLDVVAERVQFLPRSTGSGDNMSKAPNSSPNPKVNEPAAIPGEDEETIPF
jgi:single-strand DNA-binding protein